MQIYLNFDFINVNDFANSKDGLQEIDIVLPPSSLMLRKSG